MSLSLLFLEQLNVGRVYYEERSWMACKCVHKIKTHLYADNSNGNIDNINENNYVKV